jgi:hypothetical protein
MGYAEQLVHLAISQTGTDIMQLLDWLDAYQQQMLID